VEQLVEVNRIVLLVEARTWRTLAQLSPSRRFPVALRASTLLLAITTPSARGYNCPVNILPMGQQIETVDITPEVSDIA
jgi:hypothetical protein